MKVLVTGATSMVGKALATQLAERGDEVTVFQRNPSGLGLTERLGDLTVEADVRRAVVGQDAVIHLAAKVGVTGPWSDYEQINIGGTTTLLNAARDAGATRFVHISSPSVAHGGAALVGAGADPADPSQTRGHYATSKALAEIDALEASSDALPVVVLRPHLIWGPGDTQLVGRIVDRAKQGRLALVGSGTALIDSTYVTNAVDAMIAALDRCPDLAGRVFVISNGEPRPVSELIGRICQAAGLQPPNRHVPNKLAFVGGLLAEKIWDKLNRTDDPPMTSFLADQLSTAHWFDQRGARKALDWRPTVSLSEGFGLLSDSYLPAC